LANSHATKAIDFARQAGQLLSDVKSSLPHGQWMKWVTANLNLSHRQVLRYIDVSQGKATKINVPATKLDIVSNLPTLPSKESEWVTGDWRPSPGFMYLFKENDANYWVHPSTYDRRWFHVSKHYSGPRMSTENFIRRYTIFSRITDPDFTHEQYVGTTTPLGWIGVADVLKSYGLKNIKDSLSLRIFADDDGFYRPLGEPERENFYEDWHEYRELLASYAK
jgi:hypothetical protein